MPACGWPRVLETFVNLSRRHCATTELHDQQDVTPRSVRKRRQNSVEILKSLFGIKLAQN